MGVAKYLCDQCGIDYEAANSNQIGRLPYFMNVKANRPGNFRAKMLGYDPKATCTIEERDIVAQPAAKRMRAMPSSTPKLHAHGDKKEMENSEHDWQAAIKSYENGFNFAQTCAFIGKISKKQHAHFEG